MLHTGDDWLFDCLAVHSPEVIDMVLMLISRIWIIRNDLVHGKDAPPVRVSHDFLSSYLNSVRKAKKLTVEKIIKQKSLCLVQE